MLIDMLVMAPLWVKVALLAITLAVYNIPGGEEVEF